MGYKKNFVHSFLLGTRYSLSNDFEEFSQIPDIDPLNTFFIKFYSR